MSEFLYLMLKFMDLVDYRIGFGTITYITPSLVGVVMESMIIKPFPKISIVQLTVQMITYIIMIATLLMRSTFRTCHYLVWCGVFRIMTTGSWTAAPMVSGLTAPLVVCIARLAVLYGCLALVWLLSSSIRPRNICTMFMRRTKNTHSVCLV